MFENQPNISGLLIRAQLEEFALASVQNIGLRLPYSNGFWFKANSDALRILCVMYRPY